MATSRGTHTIAGAVSVTYKYPGTVTVEADTPREFWKVAGPILGVVGLGLLCLL